MKEERRLIPQDVGILLTFAAVVSLSAGLFSLLFTILEEFQLLATLGILAGSGGFLWLCRERRVSLQRWALRLGAFGLVGWIVFLGVLANDEPRGILPVSTIILANFALLWILRIRWRRQTERTKPSHQSAAREPHVTVPPTVESTPTYSIPHAHGAPATTLSLRQSSQGTENGYALRYACLTDGELLRLEKEKHELQDDVRKALESEISKRGLLSEQSEPLVTVPPAGGSTERSQKLADSAAPVSASKGKAIQYGKWPALLFGASLLTLVLFRPVPCRGFLQCLVAGGMRAAVISVEAAVIALLIWGARRRQGVFQKSFSVVFCLAVLIEIGFATYRSHLSEKLSGVVDTRIDSVPWPQQPKSLEERLAEIDAELERQNKAQGMPPGHKPDERSSEPPATLQASTESSKFLA